jgi:hypothetical protein
MRKVSSVFVIVTLLLLCLAPSVIADEQLPFKGVFTPVVLSGTPLDATHELFIVTVPVVATVLTKAQGSAFFILDSSDLTYVGAYWWPSDKGGVLYGSFGGELLPSGTANVFNNVEQAFIEGGTGRFAGASGVFASGGQLNVATLTAVAPWPFYGTVTLPGAHH